MNRDEFYKNVKEIIQRAIVFSRKARREGLLVLEDLIDDDKVHNRDIFDFGLRFVVDGVDGYIVDRILSNIVNRESDEYTSLLKRIKKKAVISIQNGIDSNSLLHLMLSYLDTQFYEENIENIQEYTQDEYDYGFFEYEYERAPERYNESKRRIIPRTVSNAVQYRLYEGEITEQEAIDVYVNSGTSKEDAIKYIEGTKHGKRYL